MLALVVLAAFSHASSSSSPSASYDATPSPFDHCSASGSTSSQRIKTLNLEKNRSSAPRSVDIDHHPTIESMLAPGDDRTRWSTSHSATITGYVRDVKPGGKESCNCGAADIQHRDTHIEITTGPDDTLPSRVVIVEVTPRWRQAMKVNGVDWSTPKLEELKGRNVRVTGWLFFDEEHTNAAETTHPRGARNWRGTAWEIHPVTAIDTVK